MSRHNIGSALCSVSLCMCNKESGVLRSEPETALQVEAAGGSVSMEKGQLRVLGCEKGRASSTSLWF